MMSVNSDEASDSFPAPAFLNFCPGGIAPKEGSSEWYDLASYSNIQPAPTIRSSSRRVVLTPDVIVAKANAADSRLRQYALLYSKDLSTPYYLPSLSILAGEAFGRLTGVPPNSVRRWADSMVLHYLGPSEEGIPESEQEIYDQKPLSAVKVQDATAVTMLKRILREAESTHNDTGSTGKPRPCGYVFKRGDIAWNCRTCQTDPTCVICDTCFHNSNHDGHEVYFHRTTPGGCCDCGDAEAWKIEGCCPLHRPIDAPQSAESEDDPLEAVKMSLKGLQEGLDTLQQPPTQLPPKLAATFGVVIGAAVNALVDASDGAGIGADPIQWKMRWADEACRIFNTSNNNEDYFRKRASITPNNLIIGNHSLPRGYRLELRLHNDDVHTFDEVIEALHEPRHRRSVGDSYMPLVPHREDANDMTQHVDSDGQVTVKSYATIAAAMLGYRQLKSKGLHCAVVSTAQVEAEHRARALTAWLTEIASAHPSVAVIVVQALVQITSNQELGGIHVWHEPRMIPVWTSITDEDEMSRCRRRFLAFPPHVQSSYLSRDEAETLHRLGCQMNLDVFVRITGTDPSFYSGVPYRLPSLKYRKSPHSLWGTLPSTYTDGVALQNKHPILHRIKSCSLDEDSLNIENRLSENVFVVDTDLRKQQESELILTSMYPHKIPGLHIISGVGTLRVEDLSQEKPILPNPMEWRNVLATSSFRAPVSPVLLLLLLDPYPTKQLRSALHSLFLSLLVDSRFKCRFAAALGAVAYRPLSTLFCAGVGTETDTPLGFTVQIFTAGSLVRALGNPSATEKLLESDRGDNDCGEVASIGVFALPIAHAVLRCIHTNLLGSTKEVNMILNNTPTNTNDEDMTDRANDSILPALTYQAGEHPLTIQLPAAPDDGFLDSRSTRHKRLPHLLRDLEYITETPGTAFRLLSPQRYPVYPLFTNATTNMTFLESSLTFPTIYSRLLRTAQGMDPQKRKISGGHVEYEQNRWLEAYGLSLNFAGTRDALTESLTNNASSQLAPFSEDGTHLCSINDAMGNLITALLRELKLWLYREGMLETGLPLPPGGSHGTMDHSQVEALQRSTIHVSSSQIGEVVDTTGDGALNSGSSFVNSLALSCATGVKMTEAQLELIESALRLEGAHRQHRIGEREGDFSLGGPAMADWLRVPHSPLGGDTLSFHLPLHRTLAKCVRSVFFVPVPQSCRKSDPNGWWKIPVLDDDYQTRSSEQASGSTALATLLRSTLRSSNCRVAWSAGPDCTTAEAQKRRARTKNVSANIASAKIVHSLADHPIRCLAAAQQIERHLWARNGSSTAGMALNYSSSPLCRSFRDLDITLVQLSAAGFGVGLGARRVFALLISRFSLDGYLCDPERRVRGMSSSPTSTFSGIWVNPPRLQDPEQAVALTDAFFTTLSVLVTELPSPPPLAPNDDASLRDSLRRELLHALAAEPRSHSEAMEAATSASSRRDESAGISGGGSGGGALGELFTEVLRKVGQQKNQGATRATSGPSAYELRPDCCDEYDPTFYHLRRQDHQHAMDTISRLRKAKACSLHPSNPDGVCLPIVCPPPKAHPRFLPCRLLLHLPSMDAAIRRALLFAVTGGSWLPPPQPTASGKVDQDSEAKDDDDPGVGVWLGLGYETNHVSVPVTTFNPGTFQRTSSSVNRRASGNASEPFSSAVIASSSVSCLEFVHLLTLQVHTLEECASLHRFLPDLDEDGKAISAGLSINKYLARLIHVPDSLSDAWALRPHPEGPLTSKGSGKNRGSLLGLLIALYEHRSISGKDDVSGSRSDSAGNEGHGGARSLTESGLKWILRFVYALVDGAPSVGAATRSATLGVPIRPLGVTASPAIEPWVISDATRETVKGMLFNVPDLWPKSDKTSDVDKSEKMSAKNKEARKAAQQRVMAMMKQKQYAFAATIAPTDSESGNKMDVDGEEGDLCIICRCDDTDGENNGPLGYLGHVQRSRYAELRLANEAVVSNMVYSTYRVAGHRGCQLRKTQAMDSEPLVCLPTGSIVTVLSNTVSDAYDIRSRRVFVRHINDSLTGQDLVTEGWASVQSSEGYVILSPLSTMCFSNTRWGSTRPIIRQCGHAAHLKCVETHTLSLHQRAAGEQPYDGRFAANIDDGEFLCPLCKQLSNILIPRDRCARDQGMNKEVDEKNDLMDTSDASIGFGALRTALVKSMPSSDDVYSPIGQEALRQFGAHLLQGMTVPWERATAAKKRKQQRWHKSIQRWDYEDSDHFLEEGSSAKDLMSLLRQQHIAWAALGHGAASAEASSRSLRESTPIGVVSQTYDPWSNYSLESRDSHSMVMELRRTMTAASGLFDIVLKEMGSTLQSSKSLGGFSIICSCLSDILLGDFWMSQINPDAIKESEKEKLIHWSQLTALISAIPCHVARDGMLSQRHEARACAAAMWAVKGVGAYQDEDEKVQKRNEEASNEPPTPLAIRQIVVRARSSIPKLSFGWGTMDPITSGSDEDLPTPFRPGVASAFIYTPLLAWDLNTFAGAVFTTMLGNGVDSLPSNADLLLAAQALLTARMIQALVTPFGFEHPSDEDPEDYLLDFWLESEIDAEGKAVAELYRYCNMVIKTDDDPAPSSGTTIAPSKYHGAIGRAILPFGRSLILLLRACVSAIRLRRKRRGETDIGDETGGKQLDQILFHEELMTCEDGLFITRELGGPLPSFILSQVQSSAHVDADTRWMKLITKWLHAVKVTELHHGCRGNNVISLIDPSITFKSGQEQETLKLDERSTSSKERSYHVHALEDPVVDEQAIPIADSDHIEVLAPDAFGDIQGPLMVDDLDGENSEEEMVGLAEQALGEQISGMGRNSAGTDVLDDSSEDGSFAGESTAGVRLRDTEKEFAFVSRSPIIPHQPSILGTELIGPGTRGMPFDVEAASSVMSDLSHLGLIHRKDFPTNCLIRLPKSFVELYGLVNKVKGRDNAIIEDSDDAGNAETAICLLTGTVMRSGSPRRPYNRSTRPPGTCTLHARHTGSGIGIFFLVQKCTVLLMHNNKSAYSASIFVDQHGEEDPGLRRGRPLFLNEARYKALETLWRQQGVPREVAQIRSTSDRVIRDNWY